MYFIPEVVLQLPVEVEGCEGLAPPLDELVEPDEEGPVKYLTDEPTPPVYGLLLHFIKIFVYAIISRLAVASQSVQDCLKDNKSLSKA